MKSNTISCKFYIYRFINPLHHLQPILLSISNFSGQRSCGRGDILVFTSQVTLQKHLTVMFLSGSFAQQTTCLSRFVVIGLLEVELYNFLFVMWNM